MAADEYDGPYTNSVTGKQIATADHFKIVRDVAIGESTWVGLTMHIQVPGKGVVAMAAGKLVFDANGNITFDAGQQDLRHDYEAVMCPLRR